MDKDTDSSEGEPASDDSSSPRHGGAWTLLQSPGGTQVVEGRPPPPEEPGICSQLDFAQLQDELMALKLHNQELVREQRRIVGASNQGVSAGGTSAATFANMPAGLQGGLQGFGALPSGGSSMLSFGKTFSKQMKEGSSAMSAFHARAQASLKSLGSADGLGPPAAGGSGSGSVPSSSGAVAALPGLDLEFDAQEREALKTEAEYLRSRVQATQEEDTEFRAVAADAQQVVAAAERAAQAVKAVPLEAPSLDALRPRLASASLAGDEPRLGDEALLQPLVAAVLAALRGDSREADADGEKPAAADADKADNGERKLLQQKIDAQLKELKGLLDVFHKQQEQITSLQRQISGKEDGGVKTQKKDKLKEVERQVEGLSKQLEASEEDSHRSRELRKQLRTLAEQAVQRDQVLPEMHSALRTLASEVALQRERLHASLEDLASRRALRSPRPPPRRRRRSPRDGGASQEVEARHPAQAGTSVEAARQAVVPSTADTGVQAELDEDGRIAAASERGKLRAELEDLRVARALLDKRTARELQELRALVAQPARPAAPQAEVREARNAQGSPREPLAPRAPRPEKVIEEDWYDQPEGAPLPPVERRQVAAAAIAKGLDAQQNKVDVHSLVSDSEDEEEQEVELPPEFVQVQRVAELEEQSEVLRLRLAQLHEAERGVRADVMEKSELIAHLLDQVDARKAPATGAAAAVGRSVFLPAGSAAAAEAQRRVRGELRDVSKKRLTATEDLEQMDEIVQEITDDNIRLRNDLQIMVGEYRKVLAATSPKRGIPQVAS